MNYAGIAINTYSGSHYLKRFKSSILTSFLRSASIIIWQFHIRKEAVGIAVANRQMPGTAFVERRMDAD